MIVQKVLQIIEQQNASHTFWQSCENTENVTKYDKIMFTINVGNARPKWISFTPHPELNWKGRVPFLERRKNGSKIVQNYIVDLFCLCSMLWGNRIQSMWPFKQLLSMKNFHVCFDYGPGEALVEPWHLIEKLLGLKMVITMAANQTSHFDTFASNSIHFFIVLYFLYFFTPV